jgi:hypothetical protein
MQMQQIKNDEGASIKSKEEGGLSIMIAVTCT